MLLLLITIFYSLANAPPDWEPVHSSREVEKTKNRANRSKQPQFFRFCMGLNLNYVLNGSVGYAKYIKDKDRDRRAYAKSF